jgi:sulfopyruvate decarboxylase subunit alpha
MRPEPGAGELPGARPTADAAPGESACARAVHAALRRGGVNFAVSLPDTALHPVDRLLHDDPEVQAFVCSREDEGVAMAVGAYLGGKVPVALMEGSGVGYCGLVLARAQIQRTPLLLLASHSAALGEAFDFHGASRLAVEGVLRGLAIPHLVLTDRAQAPLLVEQALVTVLGQKTVVGLLVPPYLFADR